MGKKRAPERDEARELYLKAKGKIKPAEIAARLGVDGKIVRKWKYEDKWDEELKKPRRGGQPGNKNAAGHGAPAGNTNAETHGAYSYPRWERLTEEQRREIQALSLDFAENAAAMLQKLMAKRADLEGRIKQLQAAGDEKEAPAEYTDRVTIMKMPGGAEMRYTSKSTAFSRRMTLEAELNRVDGRILKLVDSIKSNDAEQKRIAIERERLEFAKQKAMGYFNVDGDGRIVPDDGDGDEIIEDI